MTLLIAKKCKNFTAFFLTWIFMFICVTRKLKTTHSHLMPPLQHLYNRLAHPVDYSIYAWEWIYTMASPC